jgi:hypothetical protein
MAPLPRLDRTLETTMVGSSYKEMSYKEMSYKEIMEEATRIVEEDWKTEDDTETYLLGETTDGNIRFDRGVRFSMTIRQHDIMCLEEYTEDEVRNCWYSLEDKEKMYEKQAKMVALFESGKKAKKGMSYRGLECWTTKGGRDLDLNISKCIDAVMAEQDAQWNASIDDWERLAAASQEVTAGSAKRALAIGREYERAAIKARASLQNTVSVSGEHKVVKITHRRKSKTKSKSKTRRSLRTEDRKDVRFTMTIRQHDIMCLEEYTEDEVRNFWYSLEDKEKMYEKHDKMVARFESGKKTQKGMSYRGLECWTTKGGRDLDLNISKCIDAVMTEQDAQRNASIDDWERLAAASQAVTAGSANRALAIGREYERAAIKARISLEDTISVSGEQEVVKRTHRRMSKPKSKSKTRRSLRTQDRKDPPGEIRRESSKEGSDVLMEMRMASRKARRY